MADSVIATVLAVSGQAYARNSEGQVRELAPGDTLREGENVISPSGGHVELEMADGSPLVLENMPEMAMTQDLVSTLAASREQEASVQQETVEGILGALDEGVDLGDILAATAAGVSDDRRLDALDLRDLLIGEEEEGADLSSYLDISFNGDDTVIRVSATGAFEGTGEDAHRVDRTITLEGVDLVGANELDTVIQNMLDAGQLITD